MGDLANFLWAFATVKVHHKVLNSAASAVLERDNSLESFSEQDISNTLWSYAVLKVSNAELLKVSAAAFESRIHEFSIFGFVATLWAFATLRESLVSMKAVSEQLQQSERSVDMEPRGCAMLVWSMAKLRQNEHTEPLFLLLANRTILPKVNYFEARDVSNTLWAFATSQVMQQRMFEALTERGARIVSSFTPQAMANSMWACAKMRVCANNFFAAVVDVALKQSLRRWPSQALTTIYWSMFTTDSRAPLFTGAVIGQLQARAEEFNDMDLATLTVILQRDKKWPADFLELRHGMLTRIGRETRLRRLPRTYEALKKNTRLSLCTALFYEFCFFDQ